MLYASEGYTTHDRRFLEAIVEDGWTVAFVRFDGRLRQLDSRPLPDGVREVEWLGTEQPLQQSSPESSALAFAELLSDLEPDVVHAGPVPTVGYVAALAGASPLVTMSWGSDLLVQSQQPPYGERARSALGASDAVFVDCATVGDAAAALGAHLNDLTVFPWGVDLGEFAYMPALPVSRALRLLSIRSLEPIYDVETAVRAAATAAGSGLDLVLTIAGGGSLEDELKALAHDLKCEDNVRWVGRVPETALSQLLRSNDVHVSTALSDGSSISLLQASATGRPSIVSAIPSNLEWVTNGETGWTFSPGDPNSLAEAFVVASADRLRFEAMGRAARSAAESRANWSVNKQKIGRTYRRVIEMRR